MRLDLVIRRGMVIDGTGNPWYLADVGVRRGRIAAIGDLGRAEATRVIDAAGKVVAPGFVDAHAHSDYLILADPTNENKLLQGATLDTAGHCGFSAAPLGDVWLQEWWVPEIRERFTVVPLDRGREVLREHGVELAWAGLDGYLSALQRARPATNYLNFVGQVALRLATMGEFYRRPKRAELARMKRLCAEAMRAGAFGVSTESGNHKGMDFETGELVELCRVAARYGGVFSNHMRDYDEHAVDAMREALSVCEQAGIPMIVSHLAVAGRNRGVPAEAVLGLLDAGRERGLQVTADVMPYGFGEALFFSPLVRDLLPEWATDGGSAAFTARMSDPVARGRLRSELQDGGSSRFYVSPDAKPGEAYHKGPLATPGWEDGMEIVRCAESGYTGRPIGEVARERGIDPLDALLGVLEADFEAAKVVRSKQTEADLRAFVTHPWVAFGGDGAQTRAIRRPGIPNPTQYSIFPMILGRYVRSKRWLRWEEAIRKMTSLPCAAMGIRDRGVLRSGAWADITVFDSDRIADCPSYAGYPDPYAAGIEHVIVNGVHAVADGALTGERGGHVLRSR
jgi:N-acyl-D-aspartate/D-glutamate deacylase